MRTTSVFVVAAALLLGVAACSVQDQPPPTSTSPSMNAVESPPAPALEGESPMPQAQAPSDQLSIHLEAGGKTFTATLTDNETTQTLIARLPFTLEMDDYARQEKVAELPFDVPTDGTVIPERINVGDLYLWSDNSLVLFYTSFPSSYNYIYIGRVDNPDGLPEVLGSGAATITFTANS